MTTWTTAATALSCTALLVATACGGGNSSSSGGSGGASESPDGGARGGAGSALGGGGPIGGGGTSTGGSNDVGGTGTGGSSGAGTAGTGGGAGSGGTADAGTDAAGRTRDGGAAVDCAAAWQSRRFEVTASSRPDPATFAALRFDVSFERSGDEIVMTLWQIRGENVVRPSDGPLSVDTNTGTWAEIRDTSDATLHTILASTFVLEGIEAFGPDGGATWVSVCPESGFFYVRGFPNVAEATQLVLFQEAVDGVAGSPTVELARFALP